MKEINQKLIDSDGNSILVSRIDNIIKLFIKLKSERSKRMIGFININTKTFHVSRSRSLHLFRKLNAYGFCYNILAEAKSFDKIRLKDEVGEWLIPLEFILDKTNQNQFLHFKGKGGFELQIFVPLESIEQFKRPARW